MIIGGRSPTTRGSKQRKPSLGELVWPARKRLEFIETRLFWSGRINRGDLVEAFGIHTGVASKDLAAYQALAPRNAVYDASRKAYVAGTGFVPAVTRPSLDAMLGHTLIDDGFAGAVALFERVRPPERNTDPVIARNVIAAANEGLALHVLYRSLNDPAGRWRWIEPHSVIFDGLRWHVRAWSQDREDYRDFVLSRISEVAESEETVERPADRAWESILDVELRPHSDLSSAQADLVETDYGMEGGRVTVLCRKALLGYLLINLGLDRELGPPRQLLELVDPSLREEAPWLAGDT